MFQGRSFARKLVMLAVITSGAAVIVSSVVFRTIEWLEVEPRARAEARYMAQTIAAAIPATLSFDQPEETDRRLSPFQHHPNVLGAYVYKEDELFTYYQKEGQAISPPEHPLAEPDRAPGRRLYVAEPVVNEDQQLGLLLLVYDLDPMYDRVVRNIILAVLVTTLAVTASMLLAMRLQRVLARPVAELAATAHRVAQTKSYSVRAARYSEDELGQLTDAFNQMLGRIQEREAELKEAQEALGLSEERFRKIVNNALDAVVTADSAGRITGWNSQAERTFGWLATEAIGQPMLEMIFPAAHRESYRRALELSGANGEGPLINRRVEMTALRRGGEEFPVELAITAFTLEGAMHFSVFMQDITRRKLAEQELRDREARYRAVVDTALDGIITINERGIIKFINPAVTRMFGYSEHELIGRNVSLLMPEPDRSRHDGYIARYLETGEARIIGIGREVVGRRKNGSLFPMNLSIAAFELSGHRYFTGIVHDLTERKQAEEALARERALLRALIDNVPDAIFIKDHQCRFLLNNPAHLKLLGAESQDQATGKTDADFFPRSLAERYLADDRHVLESGQMLLNREEPVVASGGAWRWMAVSKIPLPGPDGRPNRIIGVSRDITEIREARERLEQINAELTQKNQEMEQFVYTVSHDLKSPIVTCVGFLGLMKEDIAAGQYDALTDSMQRLDRAVARMHQSINDLLELSRVGRVRSRPEQLDMNNLVGQLAEDMAPRLREAGIRLEVQPGLPPIIADPTRVTEVFENLITNAMKYGADVPDPLIEIGSEECDEEVRFFVRDNGPGIPPEYHKRIFGLFQRLDNRKEGTGVGLTIVQRIMEVHGGRVWVDSDVGRGATFWLAFPLAVIVPEEEPVG